MKVVLVLLISLIGGSAVCGQQRPHYTQYVLNGFIINPAVAGIENYTDIKASHRVQWLGLQGAPVTTYLTINTPLQKADYNPETATGFRARGENPRGKSFVQEYTAAEPHQGVGLTVLNDKTGPLNRFAASASYAYHTGIAPKTSISAGISIGVQSITLNTNKLDFGLANPVDPAVYGTGYLNKLTPDVSAGVYLYSARYFIGVSAQQIIPSKLKFSEDTVRLTGGKLIPHMFLTAGVKIFINDDISFLPSTLIRYVNPIPLGMDLNAKFQYRDLLWVGGSYRFKYGFAALLGLNVNSTFNIGYSYDYTTTRLNTVSQGTHEILLGFLLGNKFGDWCPRNVF